MAKPLTAALSLSTKHVRAKNVRVASVAVAAAVAAAATAVAVAAVVATAAAAVVPAALAVAVAAAPTVVAVVVAVVAAPTAVVAVAAAAVVVAAATVVVVVAAVATAAATDSSISPVLLCRETLAYRVPAPKEGALGRLLHGRSIQPARPLALGLALKFRRVGVYALGAPSGGHTQRWARAAKIWPTHPFARV